jgi:hypothetical protein
VASKGDAVGFVLILVGLLLLYGVIRLGVRHGIEDARRRQLDRSPSQAAQFGPGPML